MINVTSAAEKKLKEMIAEATGDNPMVRIFVGGFG